MSSEIVSYMGPIPELCCNHVDATTRDSIQPRTLIHIIIPVAALET